MQGTHSKDFYATDGYINNKDDSENVAEGLWRDSSILNFTQSLLTKVKKKSRKNKCRASS